MLLTAVAKSLTARACSLQTKSKAVVQMREQRVLTALQHPTLVCTYMQDIAPTSMYLASGCDQQPYHAGTAENQRSAAVSTSARSWLDTNTAASPCLLDEQRDKLCQIDPDNPDPDLEPDSQPPYANQEN